MPFFTCCNINVDYINFCNFFHDLQYNFVIVSRIINTKLYITVTVYYTGNNYKNGTLNYNHFTIINYKL